ncbi:MAG: aminomethyl-transferring glycine dehydrogenase subunit GcvPB [Candidatus Zixiibacteriota bacterium]
MFYRPTVIMQEERQLIYEKSTPGRLGVSLPDTRESEATRNSWIPEQFRREGPPPLPEVTEGEVMRHYVNLSTKNFHIDRGFYPLGSCTMKYNPRRNDLVASHPALAGAHPLAPEKVTRGSLRILGELQQALLSITGFDALTLQPAAGAQGELVGVLIMKAYHERLERARSKILIPDSAHGTNPASVIIGGMKPVEVKSNERGLMGAQTVRGLLDEDTAGLMITNPNTLGLFEEEILEIIDVVHASGGLVYLDGANLNAQLGLVKPGKIGFDLLHINMHKTFSTPHGGGGPGAGALAVTSQLEPFLPTPVLSRSSENSAETVYELQSDRPLSVGRVHSAHGNFANHARAYAYILSLAEDGLRRVSENAIINANYLRVLLEDTYQLAYPGPCQHEVVFSASRQKKNGARAADISKRLLDFGFHSPTTNFPLIVPEALMIEPTETESRETLERFAEALVEISRETETDLEKVKTAPHTTPVRRLDEAGAARNLDVAYLA